jgi:hypothetical protein
MRAGADDRRLGFDGARDREDVVAQRRVAPSK